MGDAGPFIYDGAVIASSTRWMLRMLCWRLGDSKPFISDSAVVATSPASAVSVLTELSDLSVPTVLTVKLLSRGCEKINIRRKRSNLALF